MGRIFSNEDITHGRVPRQEDFTKAAETFQELIGQGVEYGVFDGGFVFGSVAYGTSNRRSDFDTCIVLSGSDPRGYKAACEVLKRIYDDSHERVVGEPIIGTKADLAAGRHELDRLFGVHLTHGKRLVVGGDPAGYLQFRPTPAGDILASYLAQKRRRLTKAFVTSGQSPDERIIGLQRMLELPTALGRKCLQALTDIGYVNSEADSADKDAVYSETSVLMLQEGLGDGFKLLAQANNKYTGLLEDTLAGEVSEDNYNHQLNDMHKLLPQAIGWVGMVEQVLLPKFL